MWAAGALARMWLISPKISGFNTGQHVYGQSLKDCYRPTGW